MKHYNVIQNEEEWLELRKGKFTASSFSDLFATKTTAQYKKAIRKVVYEKLTGESPEFYENDYMRRGHELEPAAREAYEMQTFNTVTDGGFFELDQRTGASPDGLVDEDGQIEIKCPAYNTFIDYILSNKVPSEYLIQIQGQLYVTGRAWCDFVAYHPKLPLIVKRVYRDEAMIEYIKLALLNAIAEAESMIETITKMKENE